VFAFYGLMTFAVAMFILSGWLWRRQQRAPRTLNIQYARTPVIRVKVEDSERDWDEWAS
jgi:hypothetical protein